MNMGDDIKKELRVLVNANYSLIYVSTWEEARVLAEIGAIAQQAGRPLVTWSLTKGFRDPTKHIADGAAEHIDPTRVTRVLMAIEQFPERAVFVLHDFHSFMTSDPSPMQTFVARQLRDLAGSLRTKRQTLIFLSPRVIFPRDLEKELVVLNYPLPDTATLRALLDVTLTQNKPLVELLQEEDRDRLAQALRGLTYIEAENALFKALSGLSLDGQRLGAATLDATVQVLLTEKEQVIKKSGTLQFYSTRERIEDIGGLDVLKAWLKKRRSFFGEEAVQLGLPRPKGVLLLGLPGCGKSLTAKAVSSTWNLPLLKLDMGAIFGQYVGQSEENMRRALSTAEAVAPCVLWVDEIEKGFAGVSGDGGVSMRIFGTFLTWMQEQTHGVFVFATANDVARLPPELMRKGRFDELFFVNNPQPLERQAIYRQQVQRVDAKLRQDVSAYDFPQLSKVSQDFSGAEIANVVQEAAMLAFQGERKMTTADMIALAGATQPLALTFKDRLDALLAWATRCLPASTPEDVPTSELGKIPTRVLG